MSSTTVTADMALLLAVLGVVALALVVGHLTASAVRATAPARPALPDDDCAPAGLGRLVPVGGQVEQEVRRGVVALELWLAGHARRRRAESPDVGGDLLPRQREPQRRRGAAHEEA